MVFSNSSEELSELSKAHGMEMFGKQEPEHMAAISKMSHLMIDPNAMKEWMEERRKEFDALAED